MRWLLFLHHVIPAKRLMMAQGHEGTAPAAMARLVWHVLGSGESARATLGPQALPGPDLCLLPRPPELHLLGNFGQSAPSPALTAQPAQQIQ